MITLVTLYKTSWCCKTQKSMFKSAKNYIVTFNSKQINRNGIKNLAVNISWGGSSCPLFPGQIWICSVGFCGGRKTRGPGEKHLGQGLEPTTNLTHMWQQVQESKLR